MTEPIRPALSVIIPVYNTAAYLPACIGSIYAQGIDDMEVICIDDASTDDTPEVLRALQEKYPLTVIVQEKNAGQSAARNAGIRLAKGRYLLFVDSDDRLCPEVLPQLLSRAQEQALDVLYFDGEAFMDGKDGQDEQRLAHYQQLYRAKQPIPDVLDGIAFFRKMCEREHYSYRVSPCLHLTDAAYLRRIGLWFVEGMVFEDNLFALQLMTQAARVGYEHRVGYQRRIRPASTVTTSRGWWHVQCALRAYVEMTRFFLAQPALQPVQEDVMLQIAAMHDQAADDLSRLPKAEREKVLASPEGRLYAMLGNHGLRFHMGRKEKLRRMLKALGLLWR